MKQLRDYQRDKGLKYWASTKQPALIWEMRLGKTLVAIDGTINRGDSQKNLIVTPIKAVSSWEENLADREELFIPAYGGSTDYKKKAIVKTMEADLERRVWVITNPEAFRSIPEIARMPWGTVIADESAFLKDAKSKTSQLFADEFQRAKYRAILCGFPAPETELELFQQFKFLHGSFMGERSFWKFREKYFEINGYDWDPKEGVRDEIKMILHRKASVLRRVDVGLDKEKIHAIRKVTMNGEQARLYRQVDKDYEWEFGGTFNDTIWATNKNLWLSRIAGGFTPDGQTCISTVKPDEIINLLRNDLYGQPMVVFYKFKAELLHDLNYFRMRGYSALPYHGLPMLPAHRKENLAKWNSGKYQLLLCMIKSADKGTDFSHGSVAIYRSNEESSDLRAQSEDRILNVVKEGSLFYVDIVTEGTVDEVGLDNALGKVFDARELITSFGSSKKKKGDLFLEILREAKKK